MVAVKALGLDLAEELPEGWVPLEVVITAVCLDDEGDQATFHTASPGIQTWQALGLLRWTQLVLETAVASRDDEGDDD